MAVLRSLFSPGRFCMMASDDQISKKACCNCAQLVHVYTLLFLWIPFYTAGWNDTNSISNSISIVSVGFLLTLKPTHQCVMYQAYLYTFKKWSNPSFSLHHCKLNSQMQWDVQLLIRTLKYGEASNTNIWPDKRDHKRLPLNTSSTETNANH